MCHGNLYQAHLAGKRSDATLLLRRDDLGPLGRSDRCMFVAWVPPLEGLWIPTVHANCEHNVALGLLLRSLGKTPPPDPDRGGPLKRAFARLRRLARRFPEGRLSLEATAQSYKGALGRRYADARASLENDAGLNRKDVRLSCFLKSEKIASRFLKPRMIFPRSPRYNLLLASWLKPFEHWLWPRLKAFAQRGVPKTRVCAKGLNPVERAELIRVKMSQISDCLVFEIDGKQFEAHIGRPVIQGEHSVYGAAYPGDRDLQRLLAHQLYLNGSCGSLSFSREGGRASGDFNTGMGNTLVMLAVVEAIMGETKVVYDTLADGDNALLFVSRGSYDEVSRLFVELSVPLAGQEFTLENPVDTLEHIRFGQSAPVFNGERYTMVRDWRKVMSHGAASHKHLRDLAFAPRYLMGVALCEASLAQGLPLLGAWSSRLYEATRALTRRAPSEEALETYRQYGVHELPGSLPQLGEVSLAARESFARAFGVAPDDQVRMERVLAESRFSLSTWNTLDGITQQNKDFHVATRCD